MNKQKIAILTDSCSDLPQDLANEKDINILPLKIIYAEGEYSDGVSITAHDVYSRMPEEIPRTSLPGFDALEAVLTKIRNEGYEKVIAICLSSGLSGTYNMVRLACEAVEDLEIAVFDSLSGSIGHGSTALQTARYIEQGKSFEEIKDLVANLIASTKVFFSVDTLEYLQKGGRIGKISGVVGTMLQIKPIISFSEDGQLLSLAKIRGRARSMEEIALKIRALVPENKPYTIGIASGECPEDLAAMKSLLADVISGATHYVEGEIDATLATHVGPHLIGVGVQLL